MYDEETMNTFTIIFCVLDAEVRWERWEILKDEAALKNLEISRSDLAEVLKAEKEENPEFPLKWIDIRCTYKEFEDVKFHLNLAESWF